MRKPPFFKEFEGLEALFGNYKDLVYKEFKCSFYKNACKLKEADINYLTSCSNDGTDTSYGYTEPTI